MRTPFFIAELDVGEGASTTTVAAIAAIASIATIALASGRIICTGAIETTFALIRAHFVDQDGRRRERGGLFSVTERLIVGEIGRIFAAKIQPLHTVLGRPVGYQATSAKSSLEDVTSYMHLPSGSSLKPRLKESKRKMIKEVSSDGSTAQEKEWERELLK